jgi:aryl-alcohol dehydrogenase-like predicted oxidoreductase
MQTKRFGNTDLFITPVGFGSWAVGGGGWQFGWGTQDDQDSIAAIRRAFGRRNELDRYGCGLWPGPLRRSCE